MTFYHFCLIISVELKFTLHTSLYGVFALGRHWLNISDIIVGGEFREWKEGTTKSVILYPGKQKKHILILCVFAS